LHSAPGANNPVRATLYAAVPNQKSDPINALVKTGKIRQPGNYRELVNDRVKRVGGKSERKPGKFAAAAHVCCI